jgi:hypothetical protein
MGNVTIVLFQDVYRAVILIPYGWKTMLGGGEGYDGVYNGGYDWGTRWGSLKET